MNIFRRNKELNFSDKNIETLAESVSELKNTMSKIGTSLGSQELTNVLAAAMKKDSELFLKYTLTNELFGGAGALWELYCGNDKLQAEFHHGFRKFCLELKNIGVNDGRVNQVMKGLE